MLNKRVYTALTVMYTYSIYIGDVQYATLKGDVFNINMRYSLCITLIGYKFNINRYIKYSMYTVYTAQYAIHIKDMVNMYRYSESLFIYLQYVLYDTQIDDIF